MKVSKETIRAKVIGEMEELAIVTSYLFIVFAVLLYFKSAILKSQGIHWIPWSFAAVKAVIVAKFILVGRALHFAESYRAKPLIWETVYKSLAFVVLVSVLTVIEETVVGLIHGKTIGASLAAIGGGTPEQIIATAMVLFLIFLPFFGLLALGDVMGRKTLFRLFFVERRPFELLDPPAQGNEMAVE
jgi:hypothetical protein